MRSLTRPSLPAVAPALGLAVLLVAGAAALAHLTRGSTFYADEWDWILNRRHGGLRIFLEPHQEHLSLVPMVIYRLLFATVGIRRYGPYLAVLIASQCLCVALVFLYAVRRVPAVAALLAAALVMFFGPGSIDFLWAFQMAWLLAIACGIGALLALDRGDRVGDVLACLLTALSLASAGPGLAIAIGVSVEVMWTRGRRGLWIVAAPLALYVLWWILFQQASFVPDAILHIASFMGDAAAAALAGVTGVLSLDPTSDSTTFRMWGPLLLVLAVALVVWRLTRPGGLRPRTVTLLVMVLAFWLITALGRGAFRAGILVLSETGDEGRYIYPGAVLLVLLGLELAQGWRPGVPAGLAIAVVLVAAIANNVGILRSQAQYLRAQGADTAAYLGTLDMTRGTVSPSFLSAGFLLGVVQAGAYFAAERDLGTPADSPSVLAATDDGVRHAADLQLIAIHHIALTVAPPPRASAIAGCRRAGAALPGGGAPLILTVPAAGLLVSAQGAPATVSLRRFATDFDAIGTVAPGASAVLRIAPDQAPERWQLLVTPQDGATVCDLGSDS